MNVSEGTSRKDKAIHEVIQEVEESYFIGRNDELKYFHEYIKTTNPEQKILHLYGNGGIGKTYLLQEFARIAAQYNIPFILLDSHDFTHTAQGFIEYLHSYLLSILPHTEQDTSSVSMKTCLQLINKQSTKIIIAIDTYEQMEDLDRWFRNTFVRKLSTHCSIMIAGRKQLTGEWQESPAWRKLTRVMELKPFDFELTVNYLLNNGITKERDINIIWQFTKGHPLTLSLAMMSDILNKNNTVLTGNTSGILTELTKRWLSEVKHQQLFSLIEVAALFNEFDQNCLSEILHKEITNQEFRELTSLSFIKATRRGWSIHELIRDAIQFELKQRNPDRYDYFTKKIIEFYYHRIIKHSRKEDIASFFYHIGDELIQSIFFQESVKDSSLYLEPIGPYNFHEAEDFFDYVKKHVSKSSADFYNRTTNTTFHFNASLAHNKRELELIGPEYIKEINYTGASLLKDESGESLGLSIIVPIHEGTLSHLEKEPISRSYFTNLTEAEKTYYRVPPNQTAGHYIRYLEYKDASDSYVRSYLLYSLFPLLFHGGKILTSTPLPLFRDLLVKFGFQEVPGAQHYDYDEEIATPTFLLDLSGPRLISYLKQFLNQISQQDELKLLAEKFSLTDREQDIVRLVLEEKPTIEIANELYLAEITVKKALSRIYQKANVKNRIQFMKRMMEII